MLAAVAGKPSLVGLNDASSVGARELTFEQCVRAQDAIERAYWSHTIWPNENPRPRPPLGEIMPDGVLRAKVPNYLEKSVALDTWWKRPIAAEQLQAEAARMAENTRDPDVLRDLFAALGNDPDLIAETVVRQTLVDRMIRSWYAYDSRFDGRNATGTLPVTALSSLKETPNEFSVVMVLESPTDRERVASVVCAKTSLATVAPSEGGYASPMIPQSACTPDTWRPTRFEVPRADESMQPVVSDEPSSSSSRVLTFCTSIGLLWQRIPLFRHVDLS